MFHVLHGSYHSLIYSFYLSFSFLFLFFFFHVKSVMSGTFSVLVLKNLGIWEPPVFLLQCTHIRLKKLKGLFFFEISLTKVSITAQIVISLVADFTSKQVVLDLQRHSFKMIILSALELLPPGYKYFYFLMFNG